MLAILAAPRIGGCVTPQSLTIETHTKTRSPRDADNSPLVGLDGLVEQLGSKGVRVLVELKQIRVWYGGDEVKVSRLTDRGGEHVGHTGQAGRRSKRRDPAANSYSARPDDIGLHDVYGSIGYDVPETC